MAEKSVVEKLLLKPGNKFILLNAPKGYDGTLVLPDRAELSKKISADADVIQVFLSSLAELDRLLPSIKAALKPKGIVWVCYAKGKSAVNRDTIRAHAAELGWTAVSLFSIDETWSALRLKPASA